MFEFPFKKLVAQLNEDVISYTATLIDNTYDKDSRKLVIAIPRCQISINILSNESSEHKELFAIEMPEKENDDP